MNFDDKHILVIGGAGFIGSHMTAILIDHGCRVTVLDNLSTGFRENILIDDFVDGDYGDKACLDFVLNGGRKIDGILHFGAFIEVGESVQKPLEYYENNVVRTLTLLAYLADKRPIPLVYSSTASLYGQPQYLPLDEDHPTNPVNPYAWSKLMVEQTLEDCRQAYGQSYTCLRYFNAAGADPAGRLGDRRQNPSHLIPRVLQVALGQRPDLKVYGNQYDTRDGTGVRDYIHVTDLCRAHLSALSRLWNGHSQGVFNLGTGRGYSVFEVVDAAKKVTGRDIPFIITQPRNGDVGVVVADSSLAEKELGWKTESSDLITLIEHSWAWMLAQESNAK